MTKAAMNRLIKSEFFHEVCEQVVAWDYYLRKKDQESADKCMERWFMAKVALQFITGKCYAFSRNDESVSIVNEADYTDVLFLHSIYETS